jgi:hypothetical protein
MNRYVEDSCIEDSCIEGSGIIEADAP